MTPLQLKRALALKAVTFLPGSKQKRFAKSMIFRAESEPERTITEKQDAYLADVCNRFRRQIADKSIIPKEKSNG